MKLFAMITLLVLAGCTGPAPAPPGITPARATNGGTSPAGVTPPATSTPPPPPTATPVRPPLAEMALTVADVLALHGGTYLPAAMELTNTLPDAPGALEVYARGLTPAGGRKTTLVALLRYAGPADAQARSRSWEQQYLVVGTPVSAPMSTPAGAWLVESVHPPEVTLGFAHADVVVLITYRIAGEFPGEDYAPWVMLLGQAQQNKLLAGGYR